MDETSHHLALRYRFRDISDCHVTRLPACEGFWQNRLSGFAQRFAVARGLEITEGGRPGSSGIRRTFEIPFALRGLASYLITRSFYTLT